MLALAPGAAIAGLFEDGSVAQMAANVTVLPVAILIAITVWFQVNRRFYQSSISLADAFGFNRKNTGRCLLLGLATGLGLVIIAFALVFAFGGIGPEMRTDTRSFMVLLYILPTGIGLAIIKDLKSSHIFIGILLNVFGTAIMQLANSWAGFMMSPAACWSEVTPMPNRRAGLS